MLHTSVAIKSSGDWRINSENLEKSTSQKYDFLHFIVKIILKSQYSASVGYLPSLHGSLTYKSESGERPA